MKSKLKRKIFNDSVMYWVVGTGERYVPYYSGYGQKGYSYYIRMQTDSASSHGASVRGGWYP